MLEISRVWLDTLLDVMDLLPKEVISSEVFSSADQKIQNAVCVCLDVNQGGTNRNRCTQKLVILYAQIYERTLIACQKLG